MVLDRLFALVNKPEYILRPSQIVRRVLGKHGNEIVLPWNVRMNINPHETIGRSIKNTGFHDLTVTESITRLLEKGETGIDAGANIGYFTLLMSRLVGDNGCVYAFEPHPMIFRKLKQHLNDNEIKNSIIEQRGLSSDVMQAYLQMPDNFKANEGVASVSFETSNTATKIELTTLNYYFEKMGIGMVGVMKIDVEGHELNLLKGASTLLQNGKIRDIIYEDHSSQPSNVASYLQSFGYTLMRIEKKLMKPILYPFDKLLNTYSWDTPNYIATHDVKRVEQKFRGLGWYCLRQLK
ncbi:MAG TPA: FkbM family methyltransferase [Cyclobacteriaceae bacterium]|nr:FkbM family methyltransferase [Cyclobacteriaceae bacterium]